MDNENFAFIFGRITAIEYLLQNFAIDRLSQVEDKAATVKQFRALAIQDVAKMKFAGGDRQSLEAVQAEMKSALERWFDELLRQVEMNQPRPPLPWGSDRKH